MLFSLLDGCLSVVVPTAQASGAWTACVLSLVTPTGHSLRLVRSLRAPPDWILVWRDVGGWGLWATCKLAVPGQLPLALHGCPPQPKKKKGKPLGQQTKNNENYVMKRATVDAPGLRPVIPCMPAFPGLVPGVGELVGFGAVEACVAWADCVSAPFRLMGRSVLVALTGSCVEIHCPLMTHNWLCQSAPGALCMRLPGLCLWPLARSPLSCCLP